MEWYDEDDSSWEGKSEREQERFEAKQKQSVDYVLALLKDKTVTFALNSKGDIVAYNSEVVALSDAINKLVKTFNANQMDQGSLREKGKDDDKRED
jgi:hypothetical protein